MQFFKKKFNYCFRYSLILKFFIRSRNFAIFVFLFYQLIIFFFIHLLYYVIYYILFFIISIIILN